MQNAKCTMQNYGGGEQGTQVDNLCHPNFGTRNRPARARVDFCRARGELSCASARRGGRPSCPSIADLVSFLPVSRSVLGLDFSRCADGRCAKNDDISNLRYSGEANCAARDPRNSTPLKSETLGSSRPEQERSPSLVAYHAPQKSSGTPSFVGKSHP